jgi:hypothetical protein
MDGNEQSIFKKLLTLMDCANRENLTIFEQNLEAI